MNQYYIYSEAIKSIQFLVLNTWSHVNVCVKIFIPSFCQMSNKGVKALSSNSVVSVVGRMWDLIVSVPDHCLSFYFPIKSHFAHGKSHSALHECLALMSVSKTTSFFNQKHPANGFKIRNATCLKLSPFELKLWGIKCFSILPGVRSFHLEFLENCCLAYRLCAHLNGTS